MSDKTGILVRYATHQDMDFWSTSDAHISPEELKWKIKRQMAYIVEIDGTPAGLLRYSLFWDSIPFCNMLFIAPEFQQKGAGRQLMIHWEQDMLSRGFDMVMTSTQVDETAQHFYRRLGYSDCGGLIMNLPGYEQPMEMFMAKKLDK